MKGTIRTIVFALISLAAFTATASAQKWRTEKVPDCGIQFTAPSRLERLPMKLGGGEIYKRARLRPKDSADFVRAQYFWYCDVYAFAKKEQKKEDIKLPEGVPEEMREQVLEALSNFGGDRHKSFAEWLAKKEESGDIEIVTKAKKMRAKGSKLPYEHWVYIDDNQFGPVGLTYCEAAVYDFEDQQVALVIEMPLEKMKPAKPKSKWKNIIKKVMRSGEACEMKAGDDADKKKDKYADTPERKKALEAAKANIAGLSGWDYFTTPNYIVVYSWNFEKPDTRFKSLKQSKYYVERLEKMRSLYIESYPLDKTGTKAIMPDPSTIPGLGGPTTGPQAAAEKEKADARAAAAAAKKDVLGKKPFSVFRLCATYEQFGKYGQTSGGVVGWYSPKSKELVVFLGGDQMMGKGATETVTFHEGWHQFADFYFHPPESEKHVTLHRWFDEGHGDYFGCFRWGSRGWKYTGSKMRYSDCKQMVRVGDFIPWKELTKWNRQRFYTDRPSYRYAQAFSMIDFLRRGKGSRGWQEKWGDLLDMYRKVALVKGDANLAVDTAFREWTDKDWEDLTEAWKAWVNGRKFLKGK